MAALPLSGGAAIIFNHRIAPTSPLTPLLSHLSSHGAHPYLYGGGVTPPNSADLSSHTSAQRAILHVRAAEIGQRKLLHRSAVHCVALIALIAKILALRHLGLQSGASSRLEAGDLVAVAEAAVDELLRVELLCALLCAGHDHASTAILLHIAARLIATTVTTARLRQSWSVAVAACRRTVRETAQLSLLGLVHVFLQLTKSERRDHPGRRVPEASTHDEATLGSPQGPSSRYFVPQASLKSFFLLFLLFTLNP